MTMCGILGLYNIHQDPLNVRNFHLSSLSIRHRGPDDEGYLLVDLGGKKVIPCRGQDSDPGLGLPDVTSFYDKPFSLALAFRRLSILDLSTKGHQPMSTADGQYWIIFNGEIYNYLELKGELIKLGYQFASTSDTEVLLNGYIEWGNGMLNKLVGMFAFAILDFHQRKLFLARDFFGVKPLYYLLKNECFAFASEAKALLKLDHVDRTADAEAVYLYLRHGLTDHDGTSLWKDIRKLPPAHFLEISLDTPGIAKPQRYWQLEGERHLDVSFLDATSQLRDLFMQSIRWHLRSDVPVGAALSGGVDSSAIVAAMRQIQGEGLDLHTFSYLADDPALNEERWADLAGRSASAMIHKTIFSADQLID